jgi:hypothetical protein
MAVSPHAAADAELDYYIRLINTVISPDTGKGTVVVEVGNVGGTDAPADVTVILVTPFYVNFDPTILPAGSAYLVQNDSPAVPEMIRFTIPAAQLPAGAKVRVDVGVVLVPGGPQAFDPMTGFVTDTSGTETNLVNNQAIGTVTLDGPVPPLLSMPNGDNAVNYYFGHTQVRLPVGGKASLPVYVGNASANVPRSDAALTIVTPYNTKIDRSNAVFELRKPTYLTPTDPTVPDIAIVPVPGLVLLPDPDLLIDILKLNTVEIPLISTGGGYSSRGGKGMLAVGEGDFDTDLAVATGPLNILQA